MIKKVLFITTLTVGLSLFTISSCTNSSSEGSGSSEQEVENTVYQCPMDCEDGKTYAAAGQCPVCEMDIEKLEE